MEKITKTWQEAVKDWNENHPVWSAELGGIGPAYEQAIQVLLFEIMTKWGDKPLPPPEGDNYPIEYTKHVDEIVHELDERCGFSGAQVGIAKGTAWQFMKYGYAHMMNKLEPDRHILVSKRFP